MTRPIAILIDDEPDIRELLAISLKRAGMDCAQASSFSEGLSLINATTCDLCITDVRMPDGSGLELVKRFKALHPDTPIAVMTAYDTTDIAVQAMKAGAFDFLAKPIRAKRLEALLAEVQLASNREPSAEKSFITENLIGNSEAISKLKADALKAAASLAPVMVKGEPGTGKELIARCIHNQSRRRYGPFVSVDCSAIPHELLDSEFFGHEKDSFPEAHRQKSGLFRAARGGSLFLNKVSELPLPFQVKLLRALEERVYTPLGAVAAESVEVRIFSATANDLDAQVAAGTLREDLYYHLNVLELYMPPLREHTEDIELLGSHILKKNGSEKPAVLAPDALNTLKNHSFPGNVRELENILQRAEAVCSREEISATDLHFSPVISNEPHDQKTSSPLDISDLEEHMDQVESEIISAVLKAEKWNRTRAAARLSLTARQFRYKLKKHGLSNNN